MSLPLRGVLPLLMFMQSLPVYADIYDAHTVALAGSIGKASINNIDGYQSANNLRIDAIFYPLDWLETNAFYTRYADFKPHTGSNGVAIQVSGFGAGVTGRWQMHPQMQPFVRIEYLRWDAEASALNRVLARDRGGSAGLALGAQFPMSNTYALKAEASGFNDVSGAHIRQFSLGMMFEF